MNVRVTKKRLCAGGLALAAVGVITIASINVHISGFSRFVTNDVQRIRPTKVGLLLGTSKYAYGRENLYFKYRIDAATELYHAGKIECLLVSGDNSVSEYNEPQDMKDALVEAGVPEQDIYLDHAGFSTFDSMVRAKDVFRVDELTVISQKFHCERAIFLANAKGIDAVGFNASDVNGALSTRVKLRECLARVKAFIDLHVLNSRPKFYGDDPYQLGN